jgi:phosphatidylglycerophosphate synthase
MRVCGMSVLERLVRDALRRGHTRVLVRGDAARLPSLLKLPVELLAPDAEAPADAQCVAGDVIEGVQIVDEASRRRAAWALMQTCRRPYDGPGDRYVSRHLSLRISLWLTQFPVTPNQVTLVSVVVGLVACWLAARGSFVGAGLLLLLQVVLDSCDGELARIRHMGSKLGMWLDNLTDDLVDNGFLIALGFGMGGPWRAVGLLAALARGFNALIVYRGAAAAGKPGDVMAFRWWFEAQVQETVDLYQRPTHPLLHLRALGRRDLYVLIYCASCLLGWPVVALGLGSLVGGGYFALSLAHLYFKAAR